MPNYAALKTELTTDPQKLGYAQWIAKGADADLALMLNALTGAGASSVSPTSVSKDTFLRATAAAAIRCKANVGADGQPFSNPVVATAWYEAVVQARSANSPIDLTLVSALESICGGDPVTVKVMAQAEFAALTTRTGSRAEAIGFFGSVSEVPQQLTHQDVAQALRG